MHKLGWLGTGRMGAAMAQRLVDAGNEVLVWNRTKAKTARSRRAAPRRSPRSPDLGAGRHRLRHGVHAEGS